jgi:hypothetical protein
MHHRLAAIRCRPISLNRPLLGAIFLISILAASSNFIFAAELRGKVVSVVRGEPLARVEVAVLGAQGTTNGEVGAIKEIPKTTTKDDGTFVISGVAAGQYTLRVNAVGYRLVTVAFELAANEPAKEFEITLAPDNFRRTEKVEVRGDIFQGQDSPAIVEENLTSSEMRETSTVVADDPFRSIQTLPGVSAEGGDDFLAEFSVMGAPFASTSIYIDDILVPAPFHGTDITEGATLSMFTSETIEDIKLFPAAYPEKYGDAVGAAVALQTRDGSREGPTFRASLGIADSELLGEGKLGAEKRGSWLASARKSYLGYLLRNRLNDTHDNVTFYDADLKLNYDLAHNQQLSFYGVGGNTYYELLNAPYALTSENIQHATNDFGMARLGWRWTVNPNLLLDTRAAYVLAPVDYWNPSGQPLNKDNYAELVTGGNLIWSWQKDQVLEAGWMTQRVGTSNEFTFYNANGTVQSEGTGRSRGWKGDEYVQESSTLFGNRLHLVGGVRFDTAQGFNIHPLSPQVSAALQLAPSTQLQFGAGRYNQFDFPTGVTDFDGCPLGTQNLQTANHFTAGVEQRLGETTRVKLLLFDRQNDMTANYALFTINGCEFSHGFQSLEHDHARGAQIVIQSRSANRLSGWIGYTLLTAQERETGVDYRPVDIGGEPWSSFFPTTEDQKQTLNVFGSYRISPTVHVSGKFVFGSGFPIPMNFNLSKLGDYQRLDVRAEKDWPFTRWKLALYGEVLNVTNHNNPRYFYTSINQNTGAESVVTGQGLPIVPTAGLAFEF